MESYREPTLEELKEKAAALPDSKFPSWIFQITFHDFPDSPDYWSVYDMSDERVAILETVPKLKDVRKYIELHRIWEEYIADVADKYGVEPSMVPSMFKFGMIKEYIPDEPRLSKKSKEVKRYLKHGRLPVEKEEKAQASLDIFLDDALHSDFPDKGYGMIIHEPTKEEDAILSHGSMDIAAKKRMAEFKSGAIASSRRIEFVGEYYRNLSNNAFQPKESIYSEDGLLDVDAVMKKAAEDEVTPDYIKEIEESGSLTGTKFIGGRFVTKADHNKKLLYAALINAGINPNALRKGGLMSKKEVYLTSMQLGLDPESFDNPKKWEKKKRKREKKLLKQHQSKLGSMASLLTSNGFSDGFNNMGDDDPISTGIDLEDYFKM